MLDKAMSQKVHVLKEYRSYVDGQYFIENSLFARDEFTIALGLYIDDFEVANPLMCTGSLPTYLQNIGQPSTRSSLLY